jgi:hypothetical protein
MGAARSSHLDCVKTYCRSTAPHSYPGWNVKCCEDFTQGNTNDITTWADWEDYLITLDNWYLNPIPVQSGLAQLRLFDHQGTDWMVAAAKTTTRMDVVPDQEFDSQGTYPGAERNRWVGVMDFYPKVGSGWDHTHTGVLIRVNDRNWDSQDPSDDNQTRFGTTVYNGLVGACTSGPGCGALQVTGDKVGTGGSQGKTRVLNFNLSQDPWENMNDRFRAQIVEREWFHPLSFVWEPWWRAEVLNDQGNLLGYYGWLGEWTIENIMGIEVPELNGSKLLFALSEKEQGGVDADLTGTAYWIYD